MCIYLHVAQSECEDKQAQKCCTVREDCDRICFVFIFACVVYKNPKTPKLSYDP